MTKKKERLGSDPFNSSGGDHQKDAGTMESGAGREVQMIPPSPEMLPGESSADKNVPGGGESLRADFVIENRVENISPPRGTEGQTSLKGRNVAINIDSDNPDSLRFSITGELTIYSVNELYQCILERMEGAASMDFNLSDVHKIDSAGYQLIILLKKESEKGNIRITFNNPNNEIKRIFSLYGEQI